MWNTTAFNDKHSSTRVDAFDRWPNRSIAGISARFATNARSLVLDLQKIETSVIDLQNVETTVIALDGFGPTVLP